jgi:hypothetical protein
MNNGARPMHAAAIRRRRAVTCLFVGMFLLTTGKTSSLRAADARCGAYCLYVALRGLDMADMPYQKFESSLPPPAAAGYSMAQLSDFASQHGAHTLGVTTSVENLQLRRERFACVALIKDGHFVLFTDVADGIMTVVDPPRQNPIPVATVASIWDGTALLISPELLVPEEELGRTGWRTYALLIGCLAIALVTAGFLGRRRQRRVLAQLAVLIFTSVAGGCWAATDAERTDVGARGPLVVLDPPEVDLGTLAIRPERVAVNVEISNPGDEVLKILELHSSCGCAGVSLSKPAIRAGENATLKVLLDARTPGDRTSAVTVVTNDRMKSAVRVEIRWKAVGRFQFEPPTMNLGVLRPNETRVFSTRLVRTSAVPGGPAVKDHVEFHCYPSENLHCDPNVVDGDNELQVTLTGGTSPGVQTGEIRAFVDHSPTPDEVLRVDWRVQPLVHAEPASLFLGSGRPGEEARGRIMVSTERGKRLELHEIKLDDNTINATIEPRRLSADRILIEVRMNHSSTVGVSRRHLTIRTRQPIHDALSIPVTTFVKEPVAE